MNHAAFRAAVLAALLPALPAAATSFTWTGASPIAPSSWAMPFNWSGSLLPQGADDTALLFPGSFILAVNDLAANFRVNRIRAFESGMGGIGTIGGQSILMAGSDAQIFVGAAGTLALNAPLAGHASWTKSGSGDLLLGGSNLDFGGDITVGAGRLVAQQPGALGSGSVTVAAQGNLRTGGAQSFGGIAGSGSWEADGIMTLSLTAGDRSFAGTASGSGSLLKWGSGRQTFAGVVALTGITAVGAGELAFAGPAARSVGSSGLTVSAGATASFRDGAQGNFGGSIEVGGAGATDPARLALDGGAALTGIAALLGSRSGERGELDVRGGARFTTELGLTVGDAGSGVVTLAGGGQMVSASATLGRSAGGGGTVSLNGSATRWVNSGPLTIGHSGAGVLNIQGASLDSGSTVLGLQAGASGSASLREASWTSGPLVIGAAGSGWLQLVDSQLTSGAATIGALSVAGVAQPSAVELIGVGGWTVNGELRVGDAGSGSVWVTDQAALTSASAVLGHGAGSVGALTVTQNGIYGPGRWTNPGSLQIGRAGSGTLVMSEGAAVSSGETHLGVLAGSDGTARLWLGIGAPSWTVGGMLHVGEAGVGTLLMDVGLLQSGAARIGTGSGSGAATVGMPTGSQGALWRIDGDLTVGGSDAGRVGGRLLLQGFGEVAASGRLVIAPNGQVQLRGGRLAVGDLGPDQGGSFEWIRGTLHVTGAGGAELGRTPYLGRVLVLAGSQTLEVTHQLRVGAGTLVLNDQAQVRAGHLALDGGQVVGSAVLQLGGSTVSGRGLVGTATVGGDESAALVALGGTLMVGNANLPDAVVSRGSAIAQTDSRLVLLSAGPVTLGHYSGINSGGTLQTLNGARLAAGDRLEAAVHSVVLGRFVNDGSVAGPDSAEHFLTFNDDVGGGGSFSGSVRFNQRFAPAPGARLERLNLAPTASLLLGPDLGTPLTVSGFAQLAGMLQVQLGEDFVPTDGAGLMLVSWGGFSGAFADLSVTGLVDGWTPHLLYGGDGLRLAVSVPEPRPWLLMLGGAALLLARRRQGRGSFR